MNPSAYSAIETLRNGLTVEIRALRPADRAGMLAAVANMSEEARYRRFFAPKRSFTEKEIDYYLNVDFKDHVALVAVIDEGQGPAIVGGARYIVSAPGSAEVAFGVDDAHQGLGIGSRLLRHLVKLAREAALAEFTAEVLAENDAMLAVFSRSGLPVQSRRESGTLHIRMPLGG